MASHPTPEMPPSRSAGATVSPLTAGPGAARRGDHGHIAGWGADLDHKNRPAYPKERTPPRLEGVHWNRPVDQPLRMRVYHSTERPDITPVFGTSTPPSWLSGKVRAWAYRLAENDLRHWLLLMFADRINMIEGLLQDLGGGRVPNIFAEMGIKAEWKYNRLGLIKKTAVVSAFAIGAYRLLGSRKGLREPDSAMRARALDSRLASAARAQPGNEVRGALIAAAAVGAAVYLFGYRWRRR